MNAHSLEHRMACVVDAIGTDAFGSRIFEMLNDRIDADHCTIFAKLPTGRISIVAAEAIASGPARLVKQLSLRYVEGGYVSDPLLMKAASERPQLVRFDPDEIADGGYRKIYYDDPGIRQEVVLLGDAGGHPIWASFYRVAGRRIFGRTECRELERLSGLTFSLVRKHLAVGSAHSPSSAIAPDSSHSHNDILARVQQTMLADCRRLTPREAEVCARILLGYTVLGTSLHLKITINTVATHRKRAYAKLAISSQNELFARYFEAVEQLRLH